MSSVSELRKKIRGIQSTRKITKTMKMVAGARFGRSLRDYNAAKYFAHGFESLVMRYAAAIEEGIQQYPIFSTANTPPTGQKRIGLIVVTADKGLCGDFNSSVIRAVNLFCNSCNDNELVRIFAVGRKSVDTMRHRKRSSGTDYSGFFSSLNLEKADKLGSDVLHYFHEEKLTQIVIIYNSFVSSMKNGLQTQQLLPIQLPQKKAESSILFAYEPTDVETTLKMMVPLYVKATLFSILRSSYAAELSSRMRAMDNATRNAQTIIDDLTLEMNKVRQSVITTELAEITGTGEVLKE
ncbi:MAG: ATP synthase F1 subunit gamma [Chitinivibrionales bacterium]|nr:ATP synthase F1 subunit gamma [Chitinivibrionales bacterium]